MRIRSWLLGAALAAALAAPAGADEMSVQLRTAQLRATASALGRPLGDIPYGTRVTILQTGKPWLQVRTPEGLTGWMHESALTPKKLEMTAGTTAARSGTSANEVSLAAKGFTKEIESKYRSDNPAISFAWVDRMEAIKVTPEQSAAFLAQGGVAPRTGGAR